MVPEKFQLQDPHPLLPAASSAIKIKYDAGVGRHVVATRDISPGEVIFVERPIVSTICDEHYENICIGKTQNISFIFCVDPIEAAV